MGMYERNLLRYDNKLLSVGGKLLRLFATGLYTFDEVNTMIYTQNYIPVATAAEFNALRTTKSQTMGAGSPWEGTYTTGQDKKYIQVDRLDFSLLASEYQPPEPAFSGIFDGNELMISNFNVTETSNKLTGLFFNNTGTIKNIRVTANISCYNAGGIVAQINNGTIDSCITFGSIEKNTAGGTNATIGGICGTNGTYSGTHPISNCINYASVTSTFNVPIGGIAGQRLTGTGTITGCINYGTINGLVNAAGIIGNGVSTTTTACINHGNVTGTSNTGGISGNGSSMTSTNCINHGDITGTTSVGGILGLGTNATTTGCINYGTITGVSQVGGIVGNRISLIEFCKNYGTIEGTSTLNNSTTGSVAGGIIGFHVVNSSIVQKCSNHGSVTGVYFVGGIAGTFSLAGNTIDCYNEGSVSGTGSVGGCFGGQYNGNTINCYNVGAVNASLTSKGGLIGTLGPTYPVITNSYYDSQTSGMSDTGKGLLRTTAQMKYGTASSFINPDGSTDATEDPANAMYTSWDDVDTWDFGTTSDYPTLK